MLANLYNILKQAQEEHFAIPHFNINNCEWAKYILEECNELKMPVIIGVSESAVNYIGGYNTVSMLVKGLINDLNIKIPVCLHLDHGTSFESCQKAIEAGFKSVMIDKSQLPLNENIAITKQVVDYAHQKGVSVEAEIGYIGDTKNNKNIKYTDLEEAFKFYQDTNIDALAPAIGNAHGIYNKKPNLNFDLIEKLSQNIKVPLVLHGATGIPKEQIKKAINCGIAKINVNTDLQLEWSKAVRKYLKVNKKSYDPRKIISSGEEKMKFRIKEIVTLCQNKI